MSKYEEFKCIKFTDFAMRHFDPKFSGTKITTIDSDEFLKKINFYIENERIMVQDGYADFVKILLFENFAELPTGSMEISLENYQYLRSDYITRQEGELPVLSRWFELPVEPPLANSIAIVLYSKKQIESEEHARGHLDFYFNCDWGIVNITAQQEYSIEPMSPITMMRNALGKEEGGSGVPIDKKLYRKSVKYWKKHAIIK
jgi:hypothetical protein